MTDTSGKTSCTTRSWRVAACGGLAVLIVLVALAGVGLISALIVGVIVAVGLGVFMTRVMCPEADAVQDQPRAQQTTAPVAETPVEAAPEPVAAPDPEPARAEPAPEPTPANETTEPMGAPASASTLVKPSTQLPGQIELSNRKGTWKYKGPTATA